MLCEYCSREMPPDSPYCPYCGAVNPAYDEYVRQKAEEQKQAAETAKEISDYIHSLKKQQERKREIQHRRREERERNDREGAECIAVSALSSILTAIITLVGFGNNHDIDYLSMFLVFYAGNLIGNTVLLLFINGFIRNQKAKYITYGIIILCLCIFFNSCSARY